MTELPVDCPDFPVLVSTDPGSRTYRLPSYGPGDVTPIKGVTYYPHGGGYNIVIMPSITLTVGTNTITTIVEDHVLNKTCVSTIEVSETGTESPESR